MSCIRKKRRGFTLLEVLVAVAVAGLVVSAGFRLIAMSYKLMAEVQTERKLIDAAQNIWLRFRIDKDMPDSGTDDDLNVKWSTENLSVQIDEDYDLKFRRVTVTLEGGQSTVIYIAE